MTSEKTRKIIYIALSGAIAYLLARFTKVPIFPAAPFLKLDFGEVPLLLISTLGAPSVGLAALALKEVLSLVFSGSNVFGLLADFVACGTFLLICAKIYIRSPGYVSMGLAVFASGMSRMLVSVPVNLVVLKLQFGSGPASVLSQLIYILPFNFIKCVLGGLCVALLYPRLEKPFQKLGIRRKAL